MGPFFVCSSRQGTIVVHPKSLTGTLPPAGAPRRTRAVINRAHNLQAPASGAHWTEVYMAEMSPIDVLRRYQEYETELAPCCWAAHPPEASLKTYAFVEEVKSLAPRSGQPSTGARSGGPGAAAPAGAGHGRELEINLHQLIAWLMGDRERRRAIPWFRAVYVVLESGPVSHRRHPHLARAGTALSAPVRHPAEPAGAFSAIIFLTLALAVFDLGKTILEEEVLLHKDIFRHSAIRRTITRFIAAILIAVSIEGLLLLFRDPSARANCSGLRCLG